MYAASSRMNDSAMIVDDIVRYTWMDEFCEIHNVISSRLSTSTLMAVTPDIN